MTILTFSPSKESIVVTTDGKPRVFTGRERVSHTEAFFAQYKGSRDSAVLSVMGGMGQEFLMRLQDEYGLGVYRVPYFKLEELTGIARGATAETRSEALEVAWKDSPDSYYPLEALDAEAIMLRDLIRKRTANQNTLRKPNQNQTYGVLGRFRFLVPKAAEPYVDMIITAMKEKFRKPKTMVWLEENYPAFKEAVGTDPLRQEASDYYANFDFLRVLLQDEARLERIILPVCRRTPLWAGVHPVEGSTLPEIKGLGTALYGGLYGEVGTIKRFQYSADFRSYARLGLIWDPDAGKWVFPRRRRGDVSSWNDKLFQIVWNWSTDQVPRYESVWRVLYYWKKYHEFFEHPDVIPVKCINSEGKEYTRYDFCLKHIDLRAKRYVASVMMEYLFHLWWAIARGWSPEIWYQSAKRWVPANDNPTMAAVFATKTETWGQWFNSIDQFVTEHNVVAVVKEESAKRRRNDPVVEETPDEEE